MSNIINERLNNTCVKSNFTIPGEKIISLYEQAGFSNPNLVAGLIDGAYYGVKNNVITCGNEHYFGCIITIELLEQAVIKESIERSEPVMINASDGIARAVSEESDNEYHDAIMNRKVPGEMGGIYPMMHASTKWDWQMYEEMAATCLSPSKEKMICDKLYSRSENEIWMTTKCGNVCLVFKDGIWAMRHGMPVIEFLPGKSPAGLSGDQKIRNQMTKKDEMNEILISEAVKVYEKHEGHAPDNDAMEEIKDIPDHVQEASHAAMKEYARRELQTVLQEVVTGWFNRYSSTQKSDLKAKEIAEYMNLDVLRHRYPQIKFEAFADEIIVTISE